ncbi:DNA-binding transcriptional LysR family regulator [Bradyrhizobium sp. LM2.7]
MDRLDQMRLFIRVVETASFSKAAKAEGVVQSTVSKQVSALEAMFGVQLLRRTSRGMSVTESGLDFYKFAVGMLADLEAARIRIGQGQFRGRLRVTAFADLASRFIVPRLPEFLATYPEVSIDLDVSERLVSLSEDGYDVAIRGGDLTDATLIARQIGVIRAVAVASPRYLQRYGEPTSPHELKEHAVVGLISNGQQFSWPFDTPEGRLLLAPSARVRTNDAASIRVAVKAGLGICFGPSWAVRRRIAVGRRRTDPRRAFLGDFSNPRDPPRRPSTEQQGHRFHRFRGRTSRQRAAPQHAVGGEARSSPRLTRSYSSSPSPGSRSNFQGETNRWSDRAAADRVLHVRSECAIGWKRSTRGVISGGKARRRMRER